ncbi:MAG: exonuclease domain-containing protein, partial [Pseudomonadota bacterium]
MREVVFDTETTGLDPTTGDRMVEIGCVEMVDR